ncbi:glucosaminidase domain-containing protein [Aerococcaceae bacterium NML160702]|nr:glucosaminidase domain-containing protein [Aerococcaceae bacterium NML160702]
MTSYFEKMAPIVKKHARNLFPSVSLAQAALESGFGQSTLSRIYHNHFGLKASPSWKGKVTVMKTNEDLGDGTLINIEDGFRIYDSVEASVIDHEAIFDTDFSKEYYSKVLDASTPEEQCKALQGTYATDTSYASKLISLINQYDLKQYDKKESEGMGNINKVVQWMLDRKGKVTYSMDYRNGPQSYDCSSAVFSALIEGGFLPKGTWLGTTESLFNLEGKLLMPINRSQVRKGDIFVSGVKGYSLGSGGHTGLALSPTQAIHCTYSQNGIATTSNEDWAIRANASAPVYWYRVKGANLEQTGYTKPSQPFKRLNVGDRVTISNSAKKWATGESIPGWVLGQQYTIKQVQDIEGQAQSKVRYLLDNVMSWILEQDLEEAKTVENIAHNIEEKIQDDYDLIIDGKAYKVIPK